MLFNEKYKNSFNFGKDRILHKDVKNFYIVCGRFSGYAYIESEKYIYSDKCLNKFNIIFSYASNMIS